ENPSEVVKYIIAPHAIKSDQVKDLVSRLQVPTVLYSDMEGKRLSDYQVFVLDTIGVLTKVYSYADIAYVGGAMGTTGLHNILEPAVFGVPVIIGKHHHKFPEAKRMMEHAGVRSISNLNTLKTTLMPLIPNDTARNRL